MIRRLLALCVLVPSLAWATCPSSGTSDAYSTLVCADAPMIYYRMDSSSSTENDVAGRVSSCNGTYSNSPTQGVTGIPGTTAGKAVTFASASTQYMEASSCGAATACNFGTPADFTAYGWLKLTTASQGTIVDDADSSGVNYNWVLYTNSTHKLLSFMFQTGGGTYLGPATGTTTLVAGQWYLVAIRFKASTTTLDVIVNGVVEASVNTPSGSCGIGLHHYDIARRGDSDGVGPLNGTLDEMVITDSFISNSHLLALYTAGITSSSGKAGMPFSVKRDQLRSWSIMDALPVVYVDAPTFVVDRLNRKAIRSPSMYAQ